MWVTKGAGLGQKLVFNDEIATEHMTQSRRGGNISGAVSEAAGDLGEAENWAEQVVVTNSPPLARLSYYVAFTSFYCYTSCLLPSYVL